MFRLKLAAAIALLFVTSAFTPSQAQTWPTRPVHIILPWAPGGITDIIARVLAPKLSNRFGQPFIVDNKPGASGNIGADYAAASSPDGYTLLLTNPGAFATNQFLYRNLNYKPEEFAGVCLIAVYPNALLVSKDQPFQSVDDVITYARAHPNTLNAGSSGVGSSGHLSVEMFKKITGTKITNIFYRGAAASKLDLAQGRIQMVIDNIPSYLGEINAAEVRMLAVGTKQRLPNYPNVPTMDEAGVPGYQSTVWYALAAPKGTPPNIVNMLNKAVNDALGEGDVKQILASQSGIAMGGTPEDADRFFREEAERWHTVITAAEITPLD
jgi:tripartite-type tricarboxylate transporter receptor subunit TctC